MRRERMDIGETIKKVIQELILPELQIIKSEDEQIKTALTLINKRQDDMNAHLVDQSRRIDETNKRIDELRVELREEIAKNTLRIDETNKRIDELRVELKEEIAKNTLRIDETNKRIDRLYEVIVRRDEYEKLEIKILRLENEIAGIKTEMKLAA
ncbi:MAG: hypothetical protein AB1797_10040 [bacterium]